MQRPIFLLLSLVVGTITLSLLLVFSSSLYKGAHRSNSVIHFAGGDYLLGLAIAVFVLVIPAFLLGFLSWSIFKRREPSKVAHFVVFQLLSLLLLLFLNIAIGYKIWHFNKYESNIDHNLYLTNSNGDFLDTCFLLAQRDIESQGCLPNNYRIVSYSFDMGLRTVPRDTVNKFYLFEIVYLKYQSGERSLRAARYWVKFDQEFRRDYDVAIKDSTAVKRFFEVVGEQ